YESPYKEIRGKHFTLEQFMDRYARARGNFTYTTDWSGFNVPGHIVDNFFVEFLGDLLEKEQTLFECLKPHGCDNQFVCGAVRYYVIALYDDDCLDHELAHAFYYLNDDYRKTVDGMVE